MYTMMLLLLLHYTFSHKQTTISNIKLHYSFFDPFWIIFILNLVLSKIYSAYYWYKYCFASCQMIKNRHSLFNNI